MSRDTEYQRLTSEHPADHWVQRALDEQRDRSWATDEHADEHGEADVA